ncbi:MAG: ACP S-malonyltransferase [Candidatus Cloacimonadaceae bacterium]|nr:ACP S-malonyltransferase [Candidatus Cloacimonadaceae bacterium]
MKTAFIFPGQGAQYLGMANDYITAVPEYAKVLDEYDRIHGTELRMIMSDGPEDLLRQTHNTQPAILFHSICAFKTFEKRSGIYADYVAGHSLGEFSALVANGSLSWQDAMHLVHKRGEFMIKANAGVPFAMAAIIGLESDLVIDACLEAESVGLVMAVNFNTPIQTVISGTEAGVAAAGEIAKSKGAKRVIPLVVGGPFHTPLIAQASQWLAEEMENIEFKDSSIPLISNLDAEQNTLGEVARQKLIGQIISPVRWVESVQHMLDQGVRRFIEFGPQKVLSGMIKNIDKEALVFNLDKLDEVDALVSTL